MYSEIENKKSHPFSPFLSLFFYFFSAATLSPSIYTSLEQSTSGQYDRDSLPTAIRNYYFLQQRFLTCRAEIPCNFWTRLKLKFPISIWTKIIVPDFNKISYQSKSTPNLIVLYILYFFLVNKWGKRPNKEKTTQQNEEWRHPPDPHATKSLN